MVWGQLRSLVSVGIVIWTAEGRLVGGLLVPTQLTSPTSPAKTFSVTWETVSHRPSSTVSKGLRAALSTASGSGAPLRLNSAP